MKHELKVLIECGEKRCFSSEADKLCPMVRTSRFGTRWECALGLALAGERVELFDDGEGHLARADFCIALTKAGS